MRATVADGEDFSLDTKYRHIVLAGEDPDPTPREDVLAAPYREPIGRRLVQNTSVRVTHPRWTRTSPDTE